MKLLAYDPFISSERAEQLGCRLVDLDLLFREPTTLPCTCPKHPKLLTWLMSVVWH
jgi:D-3-phosphoglycerate dehydrogenase